ncbi:MAG TPA: VTT domain-containing protein [Candidatus Sulfotelmatobacter sp.]|nr:VTT domain-containing protein [Candidatus Sulfotelmatobacter sp.]
MSALLHLGAAGLFFLAILDSSPIPSFGTPDIVVAILAASHQSLWYEYAAAATAGSVLGAYLTFRLARRAGEAYLHSKFKRSRVSKFLRLFRTWGEGTLVASTLVPLPTPTSMFFAAAGASDFATGKFLAIVTICRAIRYFGIAYIAGHYGRNLLRVLRHPVEHWGWLTLFLAIACAVIVGGIIASRKLEATSG